MIQWSMKFDMYISDIHYTYTLPRHYDREKYNPEDQKYTTSIHVAYSVLLFYLDCFKTGNCLGSLRVNRVGQLATGVWVVIVYKGYFDGLDSDVDGNVLKKHNTHTHIHFHFLRISGSSLYSPGALNHFYSYYWRITFLESKIYVFELVIQHPL